MTVENDIRKIIADAVVGLDMSAVTQDALFVDVGIDSLDIATVLLEVQEKFNVEMPEGQEDDFDTLGKLVAFIEGHVDG